MAPGLEPEVARALGDAAVVCEDLGHGVEETRIGADFTATRDAANTIVMASVASTSAKARARARAPLREDEVESVPWIGLQQGTAATATQIMDAFLFVYEFSRTLAAHFETYDVLLLATLGRLPVPVGELSIAAVDPVTYPDALYAFMPNTQLFNVTGAPAMSVPLGMSAEGLPIGVQFAARTGGEATLLRLAGQLEAARPWAGRRPNEAGFARST